MITGKSLFEQYRLECGMDDDDVKAARWYKDGLIDFADWILSQNSGKPLVSGSLELLEQELNRITELKESNPFYILDHTTNVRKAKCQMAIQLIKELSANDR